MENWDLLKCSGSCGNQKPIDSVLKFSFLKKGTVAVKGKSYKKKGSAGDQMLSSVIVQPHRLHLRGGGAFHSAGSDFHVFGQWANIHSQN